MIFVRLLCLVSVAAGTTTQRAVLAERLADLEHKVHVLEARGNDERRVQVIRDTMREYLSNCEQIVLNLIDVDVREKARLATLLSQEGSANRAALVAFITESNHDHVCLLLDAILHSIAEKAERRATELSNMNQLIGWMRVWLADIDNGDGFLFRDVFSEGSIPARWLDALSVGYGIHNRLKAVRADLEVLKSKEYQPLPHLAQIARADPDTPIPQDFEIALGDLLDCYIVHNRNVMVGGRYSQIRDAFETLKRQFGKYSTETLLRQLTAKYGPMKDGWMMQAHNLEATILGVEVTRW